MYYSYRGTSLRPVTDADFPFLFHLYTDSTRCHLWASSRRVYDEREFRDAWNYWTSGGMGAKFIVENDQRPVGWVFSSDENLEHGIGKAHAILQEQDVGHGLGVVATALLVDYMFKHLPLRKIYFEVFGYNELVVRIWRKLGLPEEGVLKKDRFWDGTYWDWHIFALYREKWPDVRSRVLRTEQAGIPARSPECSENGVVSMNNQLG
jgi:RimJ/RimL family protein N-acetyltransferase